jgi:hypothetical protein
MDDAEKKCVEAAKQFKSELSKDMDFGWSTLRSSEDAVSTGTFIGHATADKFKSCVAQQKKDVKPEKTGR